ncbi:MAG: hypothetical protein OEO23_13290 [Gemmatimonadota bacterium]|nr:hypothetical protein [Gemmatimonadota bacterium]
MMHARRGSGPRPGLTLVQRRRARRSALNAFSFSVLSCLTIPAEAQTYADVSEASLEAGPLLLELTPTVEALGLGGAHMGSGAHALFSHPSILEGGGSTVSLQRWGRGGTRVTATGGAAWFGGSVAVGLTVLDYGAPGDIPSDLLRDEGALAVAGTSGASEFALAAGFSGGLLGLEAGGSVKVIGQRLGPNRGTTAALDLGIAKALGPATVALAVQNLGPALDVGPEELSLANRVTLGAFTRRWPVGPIDLGAAAQVVREGSGEVVGGGGLEVAWWPIRGRTFIGRVGARRVADGTARSLTAGLGFAGDRIRVDYAYQGYDSVNGAHSFGLAFR